MKSLAPLAVALGLFVASTAGAHADGWSRSNATTGPNGNSVSSSGNGNCTGNNCASSQRITGPLGNSANRNGSTTCSEGSCSGGATYTGPNGNQTTHKRNITRY